jgi:hypothetical protein
MDSSIYSTNKTFMHGNTFLSFIKTENVAGKVITALFRDGTLHRLCAERIKIINSTSLLCNSNCFEYNG